MTRNGGVVAGLSLLGIVTVMGTIGYMMSEDISFLESLYTTVITISTVGFAEPAGGFSTAGQILTIVVIIAGVGSALYTSVVGLEILFEALIGGQRQARQMARQIERLQDHVIVCGFGRIGRNVWHELERLGTPAIIIDNRPDRVEASRGMGAPTIDGDATQNDILEAAGIHRARGLIACVRQDADNLVIVLSVKALAPELLVIARATEAENEPKLLLAGADRIVAPQVVGAHRLAALVSRPHVADFMDIVVGGQVVEFTVEQVAVGPDCAFVGQSLREAGIRDKTGAMVLGVQEASGLLTLNPDPDRVIADGSILFSLGTARQLRALRELAGSTKAAPLR